MTNLGMVGVKSVFGAYLQSYSDTSMHASNMDRNEEETWFLIEVDKANHLYALCNWKYGKFMSKSTSCANATSTVLGTAETWRVYSGQPYGIQNAVCFQSTLDNTFVGTNSPGNNYAPCGGEVGAQGSDGPVGQENWVGWWVIETATTPSPGTDVWNTVGGAIAGIANQISPADVAGLLAALAA